MIGEPVRRSDSDDKSIIPGEALRQMKKVVRGRNPLPHARPARQGGLRPLGQRPLTRRTGEAAQAKG